LLWHNRGERRKKRLLYIAAWYFTALAALGKGAPGLVLPLVIAGAVLLARRNWSELLHTEAASLLLVLGAVCLPWYAQEYARHGDGFTDRLLFHDMYKRAFVHVHDTNAGTDVSLRYYIWQLGYGSFPWTGLALGGLGLALERGSGDEPRSRDLGLLLVLWLTLSFALFSLTLTKFHHYALPCAPALAALCALPLDRALASRRTTGDSGTLGMLALVAVPITLLVARDLSTTFVGDVPASARLFHLVTYNYKRSWPATLDFEVAQFRFGVAAAVALLLLVVPRWRALGAAAMAAVGVGFCAFTLWVYLPSLAPHFGQRELFLAYYRERHGPEEPIVAYQMNWKGENFYSGNRVAAFVSTGEKFQKWLEKRRKGGMKRVYFVVEHGRVGALKSELGADFRTTKLTDQSLNDKFALVRADVATQGNGS
jgi:4-amino-4-deoxy-L-arabinose transferase-like glycosyltransferase